MAENNDADKRPRVYARAITEDGAVETTVQGAEGETSDDVMGHLPEAMEEAKKAHDHIQQDEDDRRGIQ